MKLKDSIKKCYTEEKTNKKVDLNDCEESRRNHFDKSNAAETVNNKNNSSDEDWFQILPEADSVKNVSRPTSINTFDTTNSTTEHLRTEPKFVISPFLQSSVEPETHLNSLC